MAQNAFNLAKKQADPFPRWALKFVGLASAALIPLLLIVLCNMAQLIISRSDPVRSHRGLAGYLNLVDRYNLAEEAPEPTSVLNLGPVQLPLRGGLTFLAVWAFILAVSEVIVLAIFYRLVVAAAMSIGSKLKLAIYEQIYKLGASEPLGVARSRPEVLFVDQVDKVETGALNYWRAVPRSVALLVALLALAFMADALIALLTIILVAMIWIVFTWLRNQQEQTRSTADRAASQLQDKLLEDLRLAPLIVSYNMKEAPGDPHEHTIRRQRFARRAKALSKLSPSPLLLFVAVLAGGLLLFVLGLAERMDLFRSMLLATSLITAYFPAIQLYRLRTELPEAQVAARDIYTFLGREVSVIEMPTAQPMQPIRESIALDGVTLASLQGGRLLDDVSLQIPAIANIGFVATDTQTAKALAGLFMRYYDPAAGRVLYDTYDLRNATLDSVRSVVAFAPIDGPLFTGTVTENLICGDTSLTEPEVAEVARGVGSFAAIQQFSDSFGTIIGQGGQTLSPVQSFQISLTRALLRKPSLLIAEEPSDLGDESDAAAIDLALKHASADRTLIVLPSRLQTLRLLDRVFFFHDGKLRGADTHAELIKNDELYRHITYLRFNNMQRELGE